MNRKTFGEVVKARVKVFGTQKKAAEAWGISQQYLNDILLNRRDPGYTLLKALNIERVIIYRKKKVL